MRPSASKFGKQGLCSSFGLFKVAVAASCSASWVACKACKLDLGCGLRLSLGFNVQDL